MKAQEIKYYDMIREHAIRTPDAPALHHMGRTVTYRQLLGLIESYTKHLLDMGVEKGDRVGIWAVNSVAWVASFAAVVHCGAVAVLFNYGLKLQDTKALAEMTDLKAMLHGTNRESLRDPEVAVKLARDLGLPAEKCLNIEKAPITALSAEDRAKVEQIEAARSCKETSIFIFTTGTTSLPKAVMLSEYSVINDAIFVAAKVCESVRGDICVALPLFHSYGLCLTTAMLHLGRCVYLPVDLKPEAILPLVGQFQIDTFASVGAVYMGLIRHPDFMEKMGKCVRVCVIGGGFSTPAQMIQMETAFENAKFLNGYGQTECSPIISCPVPEDSLEKRSTTVGRPIPGVEVAISQSGKLLGEHGEIGEILVKGANLMNGYFRLPAEAQAIDADGWLHTGDIGYLDEEGFLVLCGRIKDIIIRAGENIAPSEIEAEITKLPEIAQVKVLGANNHILGESVEACIVPAPGITIDEKALREKLKTRLSTIKIPEHFFVYDSFPLNENGKLDQRTLKADMTKRLKMLNAAHMLDNGLRVLSIQVKNTTYNIAPVVSAVFSLAEQIGFKRSKAQKIRLAVEEMLTERIVNAYENVGDIGMNVILMPKYVRIEFSDNGIPLNIEENRKTSLSVQLILSMADSFGVYTNEAGKSACAIDFLYDGDFNVEEFLACNGRDEM